MKLANNHKMWRDEQHERRGIKIKELTCDECGRFGALDFGKKRRFCEDCYGTALVARVWARRRIGGELNHEEYDWQFICLAVGCWSGSYREAQTLKGEMHRIFSSSTNNRLTRMYVGGAVLCAVGVVRIYTGRNRRASKRAFAQACSDSVVTGLASPFDRAHHRVRARIAHFTRAGYL